MKFRKRYALIFSLILIFALFLIFHNSPREVIVKPRIAPIVEAVYSLGTVKTDNWYNLRLGMNSLIQGLYIKEGQRVLKGEPLLVTDTTAMFRAPFSGIVTLVSYREHEMAPAGQVIVSIASLTDMYVRVSLDQESIISIRKGQYAEMSFENLRNAKVGGVVQNVYPSNNEFIVKIGVKKFPEGVLPEMTCDTAIRIRKIESAFMIPAGSVMNGRVNVIRKGKRISVPVVTRAVDDKWTEIRDNSLFPDDKIVMFTGARKMNRRKKKN